jgi:hypothetical protein
MKVQIKTLLKEPFEPAPPLAIRMANNLDLAVLDPMWPDEAVVPKYICAQASAELHRLQKANEILVEAMEKLARLGNEPMLGNSIGNRIAQDALIKARGET